MIKVAEVDNKPAGYMALIEQFHKMISQEMQEFDIFLTPQVYRLWFQMIRQRNYTHSNFFQSNRFIANHRKDAKNQQRINSVSEKRTTNLEGWTFDFYLLIMQQQQHQTRIQVYRNIHLGKERSIQIKHEKDIKVQAN